MHSETYKILVWILLAWNVLLTYGFVNQKEAILMVYEEHLDLKYGESK